LQSFESQGYKAVLPTVYSCLWFSPAHLQKIAALIFKIDFQNEVKQLCSLFSLYYWNSVIRCFLVPETQCALPFDQRVNLSHDWVFPISLISQEALCFLSIAHQFRVAKKLFSLYISLPQLKKKYFCLLSPNKQLTFFQAQWSSLSTLLQSSLILKAHFDLVQLHQYLYQCVLLCSPFFSKTLNVFKKGRICAILFKLQKKTILLA